VEAIAPSFGGINLEDIKAPQCFDIEQRLIKSLSIPVMHDDQHGTAIVVLAGLTNAAKVVKKKFAQLRVVIAGAGAAGVATAKLLSAAGIGDIVLVDTKGALSKDREDLNDSKKELVRFTNPRNVSGSLADVVVGADVFIGVSGPGTMTSVMVATMAKDAIVFALSNPVPEILPEEAKKGGAKVVATGRSDFPNQINNALVFPGIFRGALDKGVKEITQETKVRAARALAALVEKPTAAKIIPDVLDKRVVLAVAKSVR
jgi:malate dehydrogenase (oxaloacetate-decarboxylating)